MKLVLVADTFPPMRTSGAVQLRDLVREFTRQGHEVTVLLPEPALQTRFQLEQFDGAQVLRLKAPKTKDVGYVRRTLAEFAMPFAMLRNLKRSPLANCRWEGVVWYAPSIFHGPLVSTLKKSSRCKCYLIIRDIFPEWAVDMGLMGRGLPYLFFKLIANYQYSVANIIGVQTPGNRTYFDRWQQQRGRQLQVLQNWLDKPTQTKCTIRVNETQLAGRKVFVYAGNMGVAQGMDILLNLAERLLTRTDMGFVFVGRGSEATKLKLAVQTKQLHNVVFFDEIHPDEIPDLYTQCSAGIVALDPRHKSHNIPGKFLTYMQSGLPVLANINSRNDLAELIRTEMVGQVCESNSIEELLQLCSILLDSIQTDSGLPSRCKQLFEREFSVQKTVQQITAALV
ncbi:glycosyltransferase family 4 protein [Limnobacter sp.]|uniref:glycosyltransferase family 4 protein n=1 Tax=Limnobacter sp. TaxID=2003368 RepID=UPI0037496DFA